MIRGSLRTFLALVAVVAATATSADPASHRQAVERLFELTHMQQRIGESVDQVLSLQLQQNPELREHQGVLRVFLEEQIGWQALREALVEMYLAAFSEPELGEMNAFYASPTGQKVIVRLPELVQERNQLAMHRLREHIGELQARIAEKASAGKSGP